MSVEVDLVEIIEAGLEALYDDKAERFQALYAAGEALRNAAGCRYSGGTLHRRMASLHHKDCTEAMVCSHCGRELQARTDRQEHPYGSTVAVEETEVLYCDYCGDL